LREGGMLLRETETGEIAAAQAIRRIWVDLRRN
jgi:hypothetical protein